MRQSAQSLDALSALTQYSVSCEVSMNAVLWGQHRTIAPVHLIPYSQCKPGLISLNRFSFVQRKRGNNLHLPLTIHMWLIIIQSPICNSLSYVRKRKHETEEFLPPPNKLKSIPLSCTSAKALPSSVENQYNKEGKKKKRVFTTWQVKFYRLPSNVLNTYTSYSRH